VLCPCAALLKKTKEKIERLEKKSEKKRVREREKRAVVFLRFFLLSLSHARAHRVIYTFFSDFSDYWEKKERETHLH